jgi:hypothetical protein
VQIIKLGQLDNQGNAKLNLVNTKDQKASISALAEVNGYLITSVGQKVFAPLQRLTCQSY